MLFYKNNYVNQWKALDRVKMARIVLLFGGKVYNWLETGFLRA